MNLPETLRRGLPGAVADDLGDLGRTGQPDEPGAARLVGGVAARGTRRPRGTLERDHVTAAGSDRLERGGLRPRSLQQVELLDRGVGDQASIDRDDLVRPVLEQARTAEGVDGIPHPGAPVQRAAGEGLRTYENLVLIFRGETGQPAELFPDHLRLPSQLRVRVDVLQVAATAAARVGEAAGRLDPVRRGLVDLDRVGAQVSAVPLGDLRGDAFAGERVADEDHPAVRAAEPGDAVPAVGRRAYRQLDPIPLDEIIRRRDRGSR